MGRQIQLHMLLEDCKGFVAFLQTRDPVITIPYVADSPTVREVQCPCEQPGRFCFWNQALSARLEYKYIPKSDRGPYYMVDDAAPVLQFTKSFQVEWNGRPALKQGRIYSPFECAEGEREKFEKWYNAVVRWIRKNWTKNPVPLLGGYVGPAAFEAYKGGVTLLPFFEPPLTKQWLSWATAQDGLRRELQRS